MIYLNSKVKPLFKKVRLKTPLKIYFFVFINSLLKQVLALSCKLEMIKMGEFLGIIIMILLGLFAYFLCKLNSRYEEEDNACNNKSNDK